MEKINYLNRVKAAEYLGLSSKTLDRLRISGGGPRYWKAGSRVMYDQRDLDAWVDERKRSSTSEIVKN
ncbi:MAG: helix-turn-helix domain-containing protein [Rhodospirillales bacterium]|jgi:predicted DNA-binding transcriptional regulator AlpA|nr:helix-turn-helix domain-containing protein [Rhodospirillales bacterium]